MEVTAVAEISSREKIRKLEADLGASKAVVERLENDILDYRLMMRSKDEGRDALLRTVTDLNKWITTLRQEKAVLEYEKDVEARLREQPKITEKEIEELKLRVMNAETEKCAAQMQVANWRKMHDEKFDQLEEMRKKQTESADDHMQSMSVYSSKCNEATNQTRNIQNELTTCQMKLVVAEKELEINKEELERLGRPFVKRAEIDKEGLEKLRNEKEKLAKDKSNLVQDLIMTRKKVVEFELKMKSETEKWNDERSKLFQDLKEAHEQNQQLQTDFDASKKKMKKLEDEIEELNTENEGLTSENKKVVRERAQTKEILANMENSLVDSRKKVAEMDKCSDSVNNELSALRLAIDSAEKEISNLREVNGNLMKENSKTSGEAADARVKINELERSSERLAERIVSLESDNKEFIISNVKKNEEIERLTKLLADLPNKCKKLEEVNFLSRRMIEEHEKSNSVVNGKLVEARQSLVEMERSTKDEISTLKLKLEEHIKDMELLRAEKEIDSMLILQKQTESANYIAQSIELKKEIESLTRTNEELLNANNDALVEQQVELIHGLRQQIVIIEGEKERMNERKAYLTEDITEARSKITEMERKFDSMNEELVKAQHKSEDLEKKMEILKNEHSQSVSLKEKSVELYTGTIKTLEVEIESLKGTVMDLQSKKTCLEKEIERMRDEHSALVNDNAKIAGDLSIAHAQMEEMERESVSAIVRVRNDEMELRNVIVAMPKLSEELDEARKRLGDLERSAVDSSEKIRSLESEKEELIRRLEETTINLDELNKEKTILVARMKQSEFESEIYRMEFEEEIGGLYAVVNDRELKKSYEFESEINRTELEREIEGLNKILIERESAMEDLVSKKEQMELAKRLNGEAIRSLAMEKDGLYAKLVVTLKELRLMTDMVNKLCAGEEDNTVTQSKSESWLTMRCDGCAKLEETMQDLQKKLNDNGSEELLKMLSTLNGKIEEYERERKELVEKAVERESALKVHRMRVGELEKIVDEIGGKLIDKECEELEKSDKEPGKAVMQKEDTLIDEGVVGGTGVSRKRMRTEERNGAEGLYAHNDGNGVAPSGFAHEIDIHRMTTLEWENNRLRSMVDCLTGNREWAVKEEPMEQESAAANSSAGFFFAR